MKSITKTQYDELEDTRMFNRNAFHGLLEAYTGIRAERYTAFCYYDSAGNYIGDSNDSDTRDLLNNAYIEIRSDDENE